MDIKNAADALKELQANAPGLFAGLNEVNTRVSGRDRMYNPENARQYFRCGAEAAQICKRAFGDAGILAGDVREVLDYACGYGRVTRFLRATFQQANILGADVDKRALRHLTAILGEETQLLDRDSDAARFNNSFDLIWVGSLFTHLPEKRVYSVLEALIKHLTDSGRIIFTMHGKFVVQRLQERQKTYNLQEQSIRTILDEYHQHGYGFVPYSGQDEYGISVVDPSHTGTMLDKLGLSQLAFMEKG